MQTINLEFKEYEIEKIKNLYNCIDKTMEQCKSRYIDGYNKDSLANLLDEQERAVLIKEIRNYFYSLLKVDSDYRYFANRIFYGRDIKPNNKNFPMSSILKKWFKVIKRENIKGFKANIYFSLMFEENSDYDLHEKFEDEGFNLGYADQDDYLCWLFDEAEYCCDDYSDTDDKLCRYLRTNEEIEADDFNCDYELKKCSYYCDIAKEIAEINKLDLKYDVHWSFETEGEYPYITIIEIDKLQEFINKCSELNKPEEINNLIWLYENTFDLFEINDEPYTSKLVTSDELKNLNNINGINIDNIDDGKSYSMILSNYAVPGLYSDKSNCLDLICLTIAKWVILSQADITKNIILNS